MADRRASGPNVSLSDLFSGPEFRQFLQSNHALDPPSPSYQEPPPVTYAQAAVQQGPVTPAVPMGIPPIAPERVIDVRAVIHVQALFNESAVVALTQEQVADRIMTVFLNANNPDGPSGPWLPQIHHHIEITGYVEGRMAPPQPAPEPQRLPGIDPAAVAILEKELRSEVAAMRDQLDQLRIQYQIEQGVNRGLRQTIKDLGARRGPIHDGANGPAGPDDTGDDFGHYAARLRGMAPRGEGVSFEPGGLPGVRGGDVRPVRVDHAGGVGTEHQSAPGQPDADESGGQDDPDQLSHGGGDRPDPGRDVSRKRGKRSADSASRTDGPQWEPAETELVEEKG